MSALAWLGAAALSFARAGLVGTLRVDDAPIAPWILVGFGLCVVVAGWAYLRVVASPGRDLSALLAGALVIHGVAAVALPLTSNDVFSNLAYGRLVLGGENPYLVGPAALGAGDPFAAAVGERWRNAPLVYGPLVAALAAAAARAGGLVAALAAWKLALLLTAAATVGVAYATCRRAISDERTRAEAFALVAWNPLLVWEVSAQAHNDGVMVLATAAFVWAALGGRTWVALGALAVAFYTKFAVAPLVGLYLVHLGWRSPRRALVGAALVAGLGAAAFAPFWDGGASLAAPLGAVSGQAPRATRSFADPLVFLAGAAGGETAARWVFRAFWGVAAIALAGAAAWALARTRPLAGLLHGGMIVLLTYALVAPWFHPWYGTWLLPLALVEPDRRWRRLVASYTVLLALEYGLVEGAVAGPLVQLAGLLLLVYRDRLDGEVAR